MWFAFSLCSVNCLRSVQNVCRQNIYMSSKRIITGSSINLYSQWWWLEKATRYSIIIAIWKETIKITYEEMRKISGADLVTIQYVATCVYHIADKPGTVMKNLVLSRQEAFGIFLFLAWEIWSYPFYITNACLLTIFTRAKLQLLIKNALHCRKHCTCCSLFNWYSAPAILISTSITPAAPCTASFWQNSCFPSFTNTGISWVCIYQATRTGDRVLTLPTDVMF